MTVYYLDHNNIYYFNKNSSILKIYFNTFLLEALEHNLCPNKNVWKYIIKWMPPKSQLFNTFKYIMYSRLFT